MDTEQDIREKSEQLIDSISVLSPYTRVVKEAKRKLAVLLTEYGNQRELEGASKAAIAINGELGLDLTANGHYYIDRFERLHKQKQEKP